MSFKVFGNGLINRVIMLFSRKNFFLKIAFPRIKIFIFFIFSIIPVLMSQKYKFHFRTTKA